MQSKTAVRAALGAGAALSLLSGALVSACGGDDSSPDTPASAAATAAATGTPLPATPVPTAIPTPTSGPNAVFKIGDLEIRNIRARTTVNDTTAVYFTVKSNGAADTLLSALVDPAVAGMAPGPRDGR